MAFLLFFVNSKFLHDNPELDSNFRLTKINSNIPSKQQKSSNSETYSNDASSPGTNCMICKTAVDIIKTYISKNTDIQEIQDFFSSFC